MLNKITYLLLNLAIFIPFIMHSEQLAFPGAEGFGAYSQGGKNGIIIPVTTLEDTKNQGGLRWAIAQIGPRIIKFEIGGVIELTNDLIIEEPFLTIDGSTAPGIGITLKDGSLKINTTHDIIIRYIRVRPGDDVALGKVPKRKRKQLPSDAITVLSSQNVIIDHCSTSWSSDEVLSVVGDSHNVTVQNCFITEPLSNPELHIEKRKQISHPYGSLMQGTNISYIKNLFAYYRMRGPQTSCLGNKEIVNNFCTFYEDSGTRISLDNIVASFHIINCFYSNRLKNNAPEIELYSNDEETPKKLNRVGIYLSGNLGSLRADPSQDNWLGLKYDFNQKIIEKTRSKVPLFESNVVIWPTEQVMDHVLNGSGATLPARDYIDERIINQIINKTGSIVFGQEDVGGYDWR